jgi:drug/metabolite transporter (DMT)-like permease
MSAGAAGWPEFVSLLDTSTVLMTVYLGAVSATAFCLWNQLAQLFPVNLLAGYRFLIPLSGALMSALLVPGETIGIGALIGGCMIFTSLIFMNRISHNEQ